MPSDHLDVRRTIGRRAVVITVLAGTAGLVAAGRNAVGRGSSGASGGSATTAGSGAGASTSAAPPAAGAGAGTVGPPPTPVGTVGPTPTLAGAGVGGGGLEAAAGVTLSTASGTRPARVGDRAVDLDWHRLQTEPAYGWAEGSGWAPPLRPVSRGPLAKVALLPRGGRTVFPRFRLVGFCGLPGSPALGRLGVGSLRARVAEVQRMAARYATDREPLPVLELIVTVVQSAPGRDGAFRVRVSGSVIRDHLAAARACGGLLLLNVQPGRARFLDEVRALEPWLLEPDVGVALDPEWAVGPGQVPGRVFGHTTGAELDGVAAYLAGLVNRRALPQKVMVVHQLAPAIIRGQAGIRPRPEVAVVKSVDGIGSAPAKIDTWRRLVDGMPAVWHPGFKLFFEEDTEGGSKLMTPQQVLALTPTPEYVVYE